MEKTYNALIVDDDPGHRRTLATLLSEWGYATLEAADGLDAIAQCKKSRVDLVLLDGRMPAMNGYEALIEIHSAWPELPVIMMTAYSEIEAAVSAMRNGAWDYLPKPLDFKRLKTILANAVRKLALEDKREISTEDHSSQETISLGQSGAMLDLEKLIKAIAPTEATALITGESGVGKELIARKIHQQSHRRNGPFVAVNCGAMTESLLASELFGHEKGSFTGAEKRHIGLFQQADGGSIFLDEIGETPPAMQVRLLRVLQEKEVLRVGGAKPEPINCRVLAATNRDLAQEVRAGRFREDLFYRLNVLPVHVPPLRERGADIKKLAQYFAAKFAQANKREFKGFSPDALKCLAAWPWPGNVRELENAIERAIILMPGEYIGERELPEKMRQAAYAGDSYEEGPNDPYLPLSDRIPTLEEVERKVIMETLARLANNKTEAARALGITRKTLHAKLKRYADDKDRE